MQYGQAAAPARQVETESYRYYLRAAAVIGAIAGAALGAVNLSWLAVWGATGMMPNWPWWAALIQGHGNAQLFGWCGLFIMGIACHSLPRMLGKDPAPGWLTRSIFALVLSGLLLVLFAQPLIAVWGWGPAFIAGSVLQWAGVSLFAAWVLRTLGRPGEPYQTFVLTGVSWFWLGATARMLLSVPAAGAPGGMPPAEWNAVYLHVMGWGFLLSFVLAYSLRLLPAFTGAPTPHARAAWAGWGFLTLGVVLEIPARLGGVPALSATAAGSTALGVGLMLAALRLFSPALASDPESKWLTRFARTAYFWLAAAAVILVGLRAVQAVQPVSPLLQHAFGGAARHALTVGFVSLMIVGVAWRILPLFSGSSKPHPALIPTVFGLLVGGNTLRVVGQMAAGLWGGPWYGVMGISGWLETFAVGLFALDVLRLLEGAPETGLLQIQTGEVTVSPEAPVGPLVAQRPWLVPVFAHHGMAQVSNPIFQKTVGQRVTVLMACRRFQVEPAQFVRELEEADRRRD